jgi:glycosyl-4,4'-diaponeurosporenoate acyltransferase
MWIELPNIWIALLNIIAIPVAHLALAWIATILPLSLFSRAENEPVNDFEIRLHHHFFLTRKWKYLLPDAAPWLGGFAKGKLIETSPEYLLRFIAETRRGELSHWAQILVISGFIAWNPWPANLVIIGYAILSNLPCILNLRYTRARLVRVLHKKSPTSYE